MKKLLSHLAFYAVAIGGSIAILLYILKIGPETIAGSIARAPETNSTWLSLLKADLVRNLNLPLSGLIIQLLVVLTFSRICAAIMKLFGQTQVIGEIIAGIILGKSVLALIWPDGFSYLFPESSMPRLFFLSQVGLIFFMFVVGLELNLESVKKKASAAVLVSHVSIVFPFILGAGLSLYLYEDYAPKGIAFTSFALFMGIAMSITAFPVLARIIKEKNLTHTQLGSMALTCAAVDDITAWCILAAVIGIVKAGSMSSAIGVMALSAIYIFAMLKLIKPWVGKILARPNLDGTFTKTQFGIVFITVLASALTSEVIGIHALFGAFLAGTIMPQSMSLRTNLIERVEDLSSVVFLPLFFAFTGIRTQIGLVSGADAWIVCGLIILVAIVGKLVGSSLAARWAGMSWRESWAVGTLMNTRGLMELIVLNIGYDLGILPPTIFSMLVLMAIVTTMLTGPLLSFLLPGYFASLNQNVVSGSKSM